MENNHISECLVKDLLYLIKQDDIEQLRTALLHVIDKFHPDSEIYLYEHGYSLYNTKNKTFSPKLLAYRVNDEKNLKQSHISQQPIDTHSIQFDGFHYLPTEDFVQVFTVESERSNRGLLIITNKNVINEYYVHTLLKAYNHQVSLLRNKDTDTLTGLYNRQAFDFKVEQQYNNIAYKKRANDNNKSYFALFDIDFFKHVNDTHGHVYGDEVLLLFANLMKQTFRDVDLLFRYGGEEFAVLLQNVEPEQAEIIFNRFRISVSELIFPLENKVTVSIGYCLFTNEVPLISIIDHADKALYYSKEHGRNRVSHYETLLETQEVEDMTIDSGDIELF